MVPIMNSVHGIHLQQQHGRVAQLVERSLSMFTSMRKVLGSIPSSSKQSYPPLFGKDKNLFLRDLFFASFLVSWCGGFFQFGDKLFAWTPAARIGAWRWPMRQGKSSCARTGGPWNHFSAYASAPPHHYITSRLALQTRPTA